jgi:Leucine-rich repeat (LRR) protein
MLYPRPISPDEYIAPLAFGSNLGSDTLWCRKRHLSLVARVEGNSYNDAAFHCAHAGPTGGSICRDVEIDGATPYEHLRDGEDTRHHFAYCDLAGEDTIADCTQMYITDATLPYALQLIPDTVKILFLNGNTAITSLPGNVFADNLKNPSSLQSLIMDECNISSIDADAFVGLSGLEVLNLNMNAITSLPEGMLRSNVKLTQFSAFTSGAKYFSLTALPEDLFANTPNMKRILIYGHGGLTEIPPNFFKGLYECEIVSFVYCAFTNVGFPDGVFSDLFSLQYFDWFGNQLTKVEKRWFEGGWGKNILRVALEQNQIEEIEAGSFDTLASLELLFLNRNPSLLTIDTSLLVNNKKLVHFTLQGNAKAFPSARDVLPACVDTCDASN